MVKHLVKLTFSFVATAAAALLAASEANARPEYALQHRTTTCMACHVSPFGAGARTVDGKLYGSRFSKTASPLSQQSWVSADLRNLTYYPMGDLNNARHGSALMAANVIGAAPVKKNEDGSEFHIVGGYNFGLVGRVKPQRELFALWQSAPTEDLPTVVQFGRFNAPFGLFTDEHRTFTKMLALTEIYNYEYGVSLSGTPFGMIHYDMAVTSGMQNGGEFRDTTSDNPVAGYLNVRLMPARLPFYLGASFSYHDRSTEFVDPYAAAGYLLISMDRLTNNHVSGSVLTEVVYAEHWANDKVNPNVARYFVPDTDTAYLDAIRAAPALGIFTMVNWNVFRSWQLQYKLDSLTFDPQYAGDRFMRHGFGIKKYIDSNIIVNARYEMADIGRPEFKDTKLYASTDAFWLMLQLWL